MSNDILSGGRIDESTDGPNPPSVDDRSRNILQEQKAQQDQDAVGGTQFPPRVEPLPPIPVAPEVAPPLPVVPSFDFNFSGSPLEEVREITRQAIADAFKNVTINGQSPSIEGSTISFNVPPPQPSASEAFSFQSGNANPVVPTTPLVPSPQQQPREEAQSVVVPPPSRPREEPESMSERRERENNERETRDQEIRTSLGLDPTSALDRPSEPATPKGKSISEQNEEESAARAQADRGVRASAGLDGESPMDEESDSAKAYKEAEARSDERKENNPNFDRESDIRQEGETMSEYKERQERLEQKKTEDADAIEGEAGITRESSGPVAVQLNRADGQGKVFAYFRSDFSTLDAPTLPKSQYYVGGGSGDASIHPFKIYSETGDGGTQVKVESASSVYSGFGSFATTAITGLDSWTSAAQGYVIVEAEVSAGGTVTSQAILWGEPSFGTRITFDDDVQTAYRFPIAYLYFVDTALQIRQLAFTDKTLVTLCVNGKSATYPIST